MSERQFFYQQLTQITKDLLPYPPKSVENQFIHQLSPLAKIIVDNQQKARLFKTSLPVIAIILEGKRVLSCNENSIPCQEGEIFFAPSNFASEVYHHPSTLGVCSTLLLEFSPKLLERIRQAYPELTSLAFHTSTPKQDRSMNLKVSPSPRLTNALIYLISGIVHGKAHHHPEIEFNGHHLLNEHHLMEIALLLLHSNVHPLILQTLYPDFVTQVRYLLRSDLSSDWSRGRLAQRLGVSTPTLKRRLQSANLSYRQILDEERMAKAMELVKSSEMTVSQIAIACGYQSRSRFAARFRHYHGQSPSEARTRI